MIKLKDDINELLLNERNYPIVADACDKDDR